MFLFQLTNFIKISLLVILSRWISVIFFWGDHDNMMLMRPIEAKLIYVFIWKDKRIAMKHITLSLKPQKEEKPKFISICNRGKFFVKSKETSRALL